MNLHNFQQPTFYTSDMRDFYPPWNRWFENRIYPSPEGISIFFTDVTEQQRIQDEAAMGWVVEPYYRVGLSRNLQGFRWYTTQFYLVSQLTFIK